MRIPRAAVVLTAVVGGGAALATASTTWVAARVPTVIATSRAEVTGAEAAPVVPALALVALAAGAAVALGRRWAASAAAVVLLVAGVGVTAASLQVVGDPGAAVLDAAAAVSGVRAVDGEPSVTAAPYVSAVLGALLAAAGGAALTAAGRWPVPGRRFEQTGGGGPAPGSERDRAMDDWDALGRGEDPTDPR